MWKWEEQSGNLPSSTLRHGEDSGKQAAVGRERSFTACILDVKSMVFAEGLEIKASEFGSLQNKVKSYAFEMAIRYS